MKLRGAIISLSLLLLILMYRQWPFGRMNENMENDQEILKEKLRSAGLSPDHFHLFLRVFKAEEELELWIREVGSPQWQLFKSYPFCKSSGVLGPKRKEGDRQIPEGIYHIDRFNPKSKFHLSLGLNYPNESDRILGDPEMPGSDIFIHGGCETVGCIPITNVGIEEVYQLASGAKANGQIRIPVHIFPFRFQAENWQRYSEEFPNEVNFWKQLEEINQAFESKKEIPAVDISPGGNYRLIVQ